MNPLLDRLLQRLSRRQPRGVSFPPVPDPVAEERERDLRSSDEPATERYVAWADQARVLLSQPGDSRELARQLLEEVQREEERVKARLRVAREIAVTSGNTGPVMRSVARLEAELDELEAISTRLFGPLHRPLVRGENDGFPRSVVECHSRDCSNRIDAHAAFLSGGVCDPCLDRQEAAARPNTERGDLLDELVSAIQ